MDRLRTLLLARTLTVVLDADRVASAATRPQRDIDVEKFEDELAQLGFVMSLDLAMAMRRLPHAVGQELKAWMLATLASAVPQRPVVPLSSAPSRAPYQRRMLTWLATRGDQPCPWCSQHAGVGALDPCGHLACKTCWEGGNFAGCPICHRRVTAGKPFAEVDPGTRVSGSDGQLRVVELALDSIAVARERFQRMLSRTTPLSAADREELETVIDVMGPRVAGWLPRAIAVDETRAIAVARFWLAAPDRPAMVRATQPHVRTATDVLRIAAVLMGASPSLAEPLRLRSIPRSLRRAVLQALDKLPIDAVLEDMRRHAGLWKRAGEVLHPFESDKLIHAALAFAVLRGTTLSTLALAPALIERAAAIPGVVVGAALELAPWGAAVEQALRTRDVAAAIAHLAERPEELVRRTGELLRLSTDEPVLAAVRAAIPRSTPETLLALATRLRRTRGPASLVEAIDRELLARAERCKRFARAVVDRALTRHPVPLVARARPTMWELAAIHAAARANVIYIRELDGTVTTIRRRDETSLERLARLHDRPEQDSQTARIPPADAPTFVALVTDDLALPTHSAGFVAEPRGTVARLDLIAELR